VIVSKLVELLKTMPQDAEVWHVWDGAARTKIELVWLANSGNVITADFDESVYSEESWPIGTAPERGWRFYHTPPDPSEGDDAS
jgi:hypothetical protein